MPCNIGSTDRFFAPTMSFCTDPKNHFSKFMSTHKGQDLVLSTCSDIIFPLSIKIAGAANAPESTIRGLDSAIDMVKTTRDVTGLFGLFRGIIAKTFRSLDDLFTLIRNLKKNDDVELNSGQILYGKTEKLLKLGSITCDVGHKFAYITATGISRPLSHGKKYFGFDYGKVGNGVMNAYPYLIFSHHMLSVGHHSFELGYQIKAYQHAAQEGRLGEDRTEKYKKALRSNILGLIEQSLAVCQDGLKFSRLPASVWAILPIRVVMTGIGIFKAWGDAA